MAQVTKPIILDETGQAIVRAIQDIPSNDDNAAARANAAAELATEKAGLADTAASAANTAAVGANAFATQYYDVNADIRLIFSQMQAHVRFLEKRITTLEAQVAAMAGN